MPCYGQRAATPGTTPQPSPPHHCCGRLPQLPPHTPVTVLTSALLVATMERPGSMMSVRPDCLTMSRTVSIRSVGVGRMSPLQAQAQQRHTRCCVMTAGQTWLSLCANHQMGCCGWRWRACMQCVQRGPRRPGAVNEQDNDSLPTLPTRNTNTVPAACHHAAQLAPPVRHPPSPVPPSHA